MALCARIAPPQPTSQLGRDNCPRRFPPQTLAPSPSLALATPGCAGHLPTARLPSWNPRGAAPRGGSQTQSTCRTPCLRPLPSCCWD